MEFPEYEEPEHSPARNVISGAGCGCGCLGMLLILASAMALAMIPLEMYPEGPGNAGMWSIVGITFGLIFCLMGTVGFIGSLFIE